MEQYNNDQQTNKYPAFTEDQVDDIVEIIGDSLHEALKEDEDLHMAEIFHAAVDICTILGGTAVFYTINYELWRITHTQKYKEVREVASKNGVTVNEQLFDDMLSKIAMYLGLKYPPYDMA